MGRGFIRFTKSEAVERGFQRCVTVGNVQKSHLTLRNGRSLAKKVQGCGAVRGAGGTFCPEPEPPEHFMLAGVTVEAGMSFPEPESDPLKIFMVSHPYQGCGSGVGAPAICLKLNQSRQDILFTPEAPAEVNIFLDSRVGV